MNHVFVHVPGQSGPVNGVFALTATYASKEAPCKMKGAVAQMSSDHAAATTTT